MLVIKKEYARERTHLNQVVSAGKRVIVGVKSYHYV